MTKKMIETDLYACHVWDKVQARNDESSICSFILHKLCQLARQWITMRVSDQKRAQFDSYIPLLQIIRYFTWFIWPISMKPIVCIVEDIRFAFDNRRWCNPRHFLARSRNVKWPRTWLACLHSGSRRFNDVANKWPMLYIDPLKKKIKKIIRKIKQEEKWKRKKFNFIKD